MWNRNSVSIAHDYVDACTSDAAPKSIAPQKAAVVAHLLLKYGSFTRRGWQGVVLVPAFVRQTGDGR